MPSTTFHLCLVRNGETDVSAQGLLHKSNPDEVTLNAAGVAHVKRLADVLPVNSFHLIYSSDMKRGLDTAKLLTKKLFGAKILEDVRLREQSLGWLEGRKRECHALVIKDYRNPEIAKPHGGESMKMVADRLLDFFEKRVFVDVLRKGPSAGQTKVLVVSHGGALHMLIKLFAKYGDDNFPRDPNEETYIQSSTAVTQFEVTFTREPSDQEGGNPICRLTSVKCLALSDTTHLDEVGLL